MDNPCGMTYQRLLAAYRPAPELDVGSKESLKTMEMLKKHK